jgi:hypothetical protein
VIHVLGHCVELQQMGSCVEMVDLIGLCERSHSFLFGVSVVRWGGNTIQRDTARTRGNTCIFQHSSFSGNEFKFV